MKFIVVLCSLLCCVQTALAQTTAQDQIPASVQIPGTQLPVILPFVKLQFFDLLPPVPTLLPREIAEIELPPLPVASNPCNGRLQVPIISTGAMKLTPAIGLKGQTTGDRRYDGLIIASAVRNQVDPALLYSMMSQESSFNARAVSPKGAGGLMQLMPDTAARFGVRNVFNPAQNIEASARYLRFLLDTFGGDVDLALAGYNAGEGNVQKYGRSIPPYPETKKYVSKIRQRYEGLCGRS